MPVSNDNIEKPKSGLDFDHTQVKVKEKIQQIEARSPRRKNQLFTHTRNQTRTFHPKIAQNNGVDYNAVLMNRTVAKAEELTIDNIEKHTPPEDPSKKPIFEILESKALEIKPDAEIQKEAEREAERQRERELLQIPKRTSFRSQQSKEKSTKSSSSGSKNSTKSAEEKSQKSAHEAATVVLQKSAPSISSGSKNSTKSAEEKSQKSAHEAPTVVLQKSAPSISSGSKNSTKSTEEKSQKSAHEASSISSGSKNSTKSAEEKSQKSAHEPPTVVPVVELRDEIVKSQPLEWANLEVMSMHNEGDGIQLEIPVENERQCEVFLNTVDEDDKIQESNSSEIGEFNVVEEGSSAGTAENQSSHETEIKAVSDVPISIESESKTKFGTFGQRNRKSNFTESTHSSFSSRSSGSTASRILGKIVGGSEKKSIRFENKVEVIDLHSPSNSSKKRGSKPKPFWMRFICGL